MTMPHHFDKVMASIRGFLEEDVVEQMDIDNSGGQSEGHAIGDIVETGYIALSLRGSVGATSASRQAFSCSSRIWDLGSHSSVEVNSIY